MLEFQSTFPHGEQHDRFYVEQIIYDVSIHVPARGTTNAPDKEKELAYQVSIHVPARGTTASLFDIVSGQRVSIHVPARGTTAALSPRRDPMTGFNPRSRTGNDQFNGRTSNRYFGFNPRSRTGNDSQSMYSCTVICPVSIHVPARGTTDAIEAPPIRDGVSIHVPARGTTGEG